MKTWLIFAVLLLTAATVTRAADSLSAMETRFLAQLKTAVAHQDFALFARLLDSDGPPNAAQARAYAAIEPLDLIFSNLARTYQFGPPGDCAPGTPGLSVMKIYGAMPSRVLETSPVVAVLTVKLARHPVLIPKPPSATPDWSPPLRYEETTAILPLIERKGRLLLVNAGFAGEGPTTARRE
jgi:hypothetical protein